MKQRPRGSTLMTTLGSISILASLGFVLSQVCVQYLTLTGIRESRQAALDLARSASSLALARLAQDASFGLNADTPLLVVSGQQSKDQGMVVFDRALAQQRNLPYSLNNLQGRTALPGSSGNSIASGTAHIVGVGFAGGQKRKVEVTLAIPPFPFAVASSGPIQARRGVEIAGLSAPMLTPELEPSQYSEANLVSNDPSPDAVFLGPNTRIQGSVQAVGGISLDPAAPAGSIRVEGRMRSQAEHELIPPQEISAYDPLIQGQAYTPIDVPSLATGSNRLAGRLRRAGSLSVEDGLRLEGCMLFVEGNVHIRGGLAGRGVLVATGAVQVEGQSRFESGNGVAILSGGDLSLSGSSSDGSFLQGLVYTRGRFSADRVTLVGSLIAHDEQGRSPVFLTDSRILQSPNPAISVSLGPGQPQVPPPTNPQQGPSLGTLQVTIFDRETGTQRTTIPVQIFQGEGGVWLQIGSFPAELVTPDLVLDRILQSIPPSSFQPFRVRLQQILQAYDPAWQPPATSVNPTPPASVVTVDPSSFLKVEERMRVVLWREDS